MMDDAKTADSNYKNGNPRVLEGIPIGLKDNINTMDSPTTGGSISLLNHIPKYDCTIWNYLKTAGMINAGKANMHEFAFGTTSKNAHYGPAKSAFDSSRSAGGSSGGSGGCVGTGTVPVSLGTDTGGSIRIPATSNGVIGYKPTINRWAADYGIKMSHGRDTIGPLGVTMDDIALLDEVVSN
jgi:mandelamide amidase